LNYLDKYIIHYKDLKDEIYTFDFDIDDKFFEQYEFSEIKKGNAKVRITLYKEPDLLTLSFLIDGYINIMCDRCLDNFNMPFNCKEIIYVNFGEKNYEQSEDIIIVSHTESEINIAQYIYEFINLSIPYTRIHPVDENGDSKCNKQILEKIEELSVKKDIDKKNTRWNKLKDLIVSSN
jgi:uncharacterized metal-binding protein YceD (DUF177 family)